MSAKGRTLNKKEMKKLIFVLFTSMLFLTSCNATNAINSDRNTIKGGGNIVSQERTASTFSGITINGVANVNIYPGEDYKVVVTTDKNLQNYVSIEVKNNVLYVNTKDNLKPTKLTVDVHLPELQSINLAGVSNVTVSDGNASNLEITSSGVGNIYAQNFQVQNVVITQSGVGNASVWATNSLSGTLSGVGNIRYKGNPVVGVKVSGVGNVKNL